MGKKSDELPEARVSATEASRSFSKLLDAVAAGGRFLVHRRGENVCAMVPPPTAPPVRRASECVALLRGRTPIVLDDRFAADLRDVLRGEVVEEPPEWAS